MQMNTGKRTQHPGRRANPAFWAALSIFAAMAVVLTLLLAGRNKAFALDIPADYALNIDQLTTGSGIHHEGGNTYQIIDEAGFITLARVSQENSLDGYTFRIARRGEMSLSVVYDEENRVLSDKSFFGIGSKDVPFRGEIVLVGDVTADTAIQMTGWKVLFNNLSTKASIRSEGGGFKLVAHEEGAFSLCDTLTIEAGGTALDISGFRFAAKNGDKGIVTTDRSAGLVAAKVTGAGTCAVDLTASMTANGAYEVQSGGTVGGLFAAVESGATLSVTLPEGLSLTATTRSGHAGVLVGANSGDLTVSGAVSVSGTAEAGDGYAAGLVGVNSKSIRFAGSTTVSSITVSGTYAGGIVGKNEQNASVDFAGNVALTQAVVEGNRIGGVAGVCEGSFAATECTVDRATLTATGEAPVMGGFAGLYTAQEAAAIENISVSAAEFVGTGADTAHTVGGYFGLLTANAPVTFFSDASSEFTFRSVNSGDMGGLMGRITGNSAVAVGGKTATSRLTVTNTFRNSGFSGTLGGAVGAAEGSVYLKADKLTVTNSAEKMAAGMADLLGVAAAGTVVDVSEITYKNTGSASVLISETQEGTVLRISGTVTDQSDQSGHIVRTQTNSLLYAEGGVSYIAAEPAGNDVGNYGQILRNGNIGNIIAFDESDHSVSLNGKLNSGSISLSGTADAARLAITLQTHGVFSGVEGITRSNYSTLLTGNKTIDLTASLDLRNTGVEQFTCAAKGTPFKGTVNGNGHTLTLAMGESIRQESANAGYKNVGIVRDDVNARTYMGAFSALSGAAVRDLTVDGIITYRDQVEASGTTIRMGGLAGYASKGVTVSGCTTNMAITLDGPDSWAYRNNVYAGGFIGQVETGNATLSVTDSTVAAAIIHKSGYLNMADKGDTVCFGGAIGKAATGRNAAFTGNVIRAQIRQELPVSNAYVGGCIADLSCSNYVDVDMSGTYADGAVVASNASVSSSSTAGGLIGHSFRQCRVTLDSAWTGTVSGQKSLGGLLYKLDGKLTVNDGFSAKESSFTSPAGDRGILLGDGTDAFVLIKCDSSGFEGVMASGFDLFAGKNITAWASNNIAANGGLITVETNSAIGRMPDESNGWYALMNDHSNSNTRYYFNVAGLEKHGAVSAVNEQADLIYWNVYDFVQNALPSYVMADSFPAAANNIRSASADINMSGYCFYPTKKEGVQFNFSGKKLTFGMDYLPTAGQFYALQSGVFSDITTSTGDITATFENIILAGTVQGVNGGSGAFVCGTIGGKSDKDGTATARITARNVFLSGLKVAGEVTGYRPLLIHTIDSYSACTISDVSQYTSETYKAAKKVNTYGSGDKAASSLIGHGGVTSGGKMSEYVSVVFKDVVLAGENEDSVFTQATLFYDMSCTDNTSSFTYNFNLADDWTNATTHVKAVTYGKELSTNSKQYEYHDQKLIIDPNQYPKQDSGTNANFSSGYMPYVRATAADSATLRVNWKVVVFDGGWGTYEHPYLISKPEQLTFLSELVGGTITGFDSGWAILYPEKSGSTLDYTAGELYTADSSGALNNADRTKTLSTAELLSYLRGAYYKITVHTLTAEDGFAGIGNNVHPFHGVITGYSAEEKTVIQMPDKTNIDSSGYGFINAANGCAVYGLEIRYGTVGLSGSNYGSASSRPFNKSADTGVSHFGGVIAWVIGGDNVIDHVSVSVDKLTAGHKTSVFGGYVGFVTGGGVTVRGLGGGVSNDLTGADSAYYYYSPYVGKMLCGYVLTDKEGQRYSNTDKNYDIPIITKNAANTLYQSSTFTLEDADDMYMLGFALNGGAFGYSADLISYGKDALSRHGDYSAVGTVAPAGVTIDDGRYADDKTLGGQTIFHSYFGLQKGTNLKSTDFDILFTGSTYDLSAYPDAFRGFGSPYDGTECFKVRRLTGQVDKDGNPATTITLAIDLKQYFTAPSYEPDSVKNLALVPESLVSGNVYSNITVSGKVALTVYHLGNNGKPLDYKAEKYNKKMVFCLAGFVGYADSSKFENVAVRNLTVESPGWASGLVSSEFTNSKSTVNKCRIDNLSAKGLQSTGAVYAFLRAKDTNLNDVVVSNSQILVQTSGFDNHISDIYNGSVGGFVGYTMSGSLNINDSAIHDTSVLMLTKNSGGNTNVGNSNSGGFVGYSSSGLSITSCQLDGSVVASVLANPNDSQASDYAGTVELNSAVYDRVQNIAAYMLDKKVSVKTGDVGGFVGYSAAKASIQDSSLTSNARHSAVILSSKNAAGFVGSSVSSATQSYTNLQAKADTQPIYIMGVARAAGVAAYGSNSVTASGLTVQGTEAAPVYILADGTNAPAAGLFADIQYGNISLSDDGAEVSGCVIAGDRAAGALGTEANGRDVILSNLKIFSNFIQGGSNSAAGVLNTVCTSNGHTTLDGLYLGHNVIRKGGTEHAGVIADTVLGNGASLTGYDLLLKDNDAGYVTKARTAKELLGVSVSELKNIPGNNPENAGLVAYQNSGTVNILAISSEGENYPAFKNNYSRNDHVLFAGYGAPSVFEAGHAGNPAYTPKEALQDCGISIDGLTGIFNGDPMTAQNGQPVADVLNEKTADSSDRLWGNAALHLESTGMEKLSAFAADVQKNADLPVLYITGKTDDTMTDYLNLLTNGGYGKMDGAFQIRSAVSDRYRLAEDGTLSKVEGDAGSIRYEGGKFVAGKYDDLESADSSTLSILTVSFEDTAKTHIYTMYAVVYYPQILEYKSTISALEGEVYQISAFTQRTDGKNSEIDIMAGSKFAFYMEFAYNSVAEKIEEYNLDKSLYSHAMDSQTKDGDKFTAGTKLVLVDLNSKNAAGFKGYYYTADSDTATIELGRFTRGADIAFDELDLQQVVQNNLSGMIADPNYPHVERYLMVVIPPETDQAQKQFNLIAEVDKENSKNIIVKGEEQSGYISVWSPPGGELKFDEEQTSALFSNTPDKALESELSVRQTFATGYISAMKGRALYGTHILRITKNGENSGISLPAGTVVTLTRPDGTLLMSTRLTQPSSSVRYSVGNVLDNITTANPTYSDDIVISLDFSGASPLEFNRSFEDGYQYTLRDSFYLSGDTEHYVGGTEASCATKTIKAEKASPIKLALVPQERKHLAINFGNLAETSDDGRIVFDLAADFSAVLDENIIDRRATVKFSVLKKVLGDDGKYVYEELPQVNSVVKSLTGVGDGPTVDADQTAYLGNLSDGSKTNNAFCLAVDMDAIRGLIPSDDTQAQDYDVFTNYRLQAEVTLTGTNRDKGEEVSYKATGYFVFLLCNIHADVF